VYLENRRNGPKIRTSRKELRKNGRAENKKRKADHFASVHSNQNKITTGEEHTDAPEPKRLRTDGPTYSSTQTKGKSKSKTPLEKLVEHSERPAISKKSRSQQEEHEDNYISYLESKLGWQKGGSKTASYGSGLGDDGLDGNSASLLDIITKIADRFIERLG
jgi:nucleolar MIF4G domain-containing protein 1